MILSSFLRSSLLSALCAGTFATAVGAGEPPLSGQLVTRHSSLITGESGFPASPYGVCSHLTWGEFSARDRTFSLCRVAGLGTVRCDFTWSMVEKPKGSWDFSRTDVIVADAKAAGIAILPILYWDKNDYPKPHVDPDPWRDYIRHVAERYVDDIPVFEIWNEQDLRSKDNVGNPTNYLAVLKSAYEEIKAASPGARVAVGGYCGIPLRYIEELYKLGGGAYFDIMNIHGYSVPDRPEGATLDVQTDKLKDLMAKYGDAGKPIWCTEIGWPTNDSMPEYDIRKDGWAYGPGVSDESQAIYTSRALGLAMAQGYEKIYFYEFRETFTRKRFWRESHFGLVRVNFIPKPAWIAYATFTAMRPAGSVQKDVMWRDESRILYFPQWKRPDGTDAGMLWTTGTPLTTRLRFTTENVGFYNHLGKEIYPEPVEGGGYSVSVSGEPVYFVGGALEVE